MRKYINIIANCIMTVVLTSIVLLRLTDLFENKLSIEKYADFFEQQEDFDVLFLGTSHVLDAIYPMELWNDYGIVSYNLGGHANEIATSYWVLENALQYTNPKLVVIDCLKVDSSVKGSGNFSYLHYSLDAFPMNTTKLKAIKDLLNDEAWENARGVPQDKYVEDPRTKIALLWNYSQYHNRWNEIEKNDYLTDVNLQKGAELQINVAEGQLDRISSNDKVLSGSIGDQYLKKIIEECKSRNIEVLLTFVPFPATEYEQKEANYIYDLANEYNISYINFLDLDVINYETDLYDDFSHLNPSGARKVTDYLGQYLEECYEISDQRDNAQYREWDNDYGKYTELKNSKIKCEKNINNYLMLLSGDDLNVDITIYNQEIYQKGKIPELLANIGCETNLDNSYIEIEGMDNVDVSMHMVVQRDGELIDEAYYDYRTDTLYHN